MLRPKEAGELTMPRPFMLRFRLFKLRPFIFMFMFIMFIAATAFRVCPCDDEDGVAAEREDWGEVEFAETDAAATEAFVRLF